MIPQPQHVLRGAPAPLSGEQPADPRVRAAAARWLPGIELRVAGAAGAGAVPRLGDDESYRLTVGRGAVLIQAATTWGVLRGIASASQLLRGGGLQDGLSIADAPRFAWRGLMLDPARHFLPVDLIERVLDGMALLKLNVLHLHLSDDQGFRVASRRYPRLSSADAYSLTELRALVAYAAALGIRVVPELDMPGHVTSWLAGMPELGAQPVPATQRFGVHKACLNVTDENVLGVLEGLLAELAEVFPDDYFHIGGDEVHPAWWGAAADELQVSFNQRMYGVLGALGKKMMGWDEVLHEDMPDMLVQCWRGATTRDRARALGRDTIVSSGWYLDLFYPNETHYRYDPAAEQAQLLALEDAWQADPRMAHVAGGLEWTRQWREGAVSAPGEGRMLGGEACLWSELVDADILPVRLWSRLPAVAERLWSSADVADVDDFHVRLAALFELEEFDIRAMARRNLARLGLNESQLTAAAYLEPVKWYARLLGDAALQARLSGREMPQARPYDTTTPLNRIVDFISPESFISRALGSATVAELTETAACWARLEPQTWPADVRGAVQALQTLGEALGGWLRGELTDGQCSSRIRGLYGPYGEYLLAPVPVLLERLADAP